MISRKILIPTGSRRQSGSDGILGDCWKSGALGQIDGFNATAWKFNMDTRLPVGPDSHQKFALRSTNEMYLNFESAIYREPGHPLRFTYPAIIRLLRNSKSR